ncbi:MAG: hypothetical protein R8N23_10460 [Reichenbachiella sp.]|uniref:hypothetical protein n=1 Tax=Reichenbachiella sp. TaxID=2184521 RepID=UPI0029676013|nr:hypothetical protein [Reichenbachiella sp.]MDW3210280.1 hypothetical protein [Reichenbachiella sp.]
MITDKSNRDMQVRKTLKISDNAIIWGAYTSPFWETFFNKHWEKTCLLLLKQYARFNKAMLATMHWCLFRFKAGSQTIGILAICSALSFSLSFNSTHVPILLKPLAMFLVPVLPFFKTPSELYQLAFIDVESKFLLVYTGLFTLTSLTHLIAVWIGKGNSSLTMRGQSWIGLGLSKFLPVNEFLCSLLDFAIAVGIGIAAWKYVGDAHFGIFMISTASAELAQQVLDRSYQAHTRSILNA